MFSSLFSVFPALFLGLSSLASAAPTSVQPVELLAFAPSITYPCNGTVWVIGDIQHVDWRTDNVPAEAQNYTLTVLLGYLANNSENLDIKNPLATQVSIMQGTVPVTVPNVPYRTNYTVAVIGDSGDISPLFTITP